MRNQREESNPVSCRLSDRIPAGEDVPLLDPLQLMLFSYVAHAWIVTPEHTEGAGHLNRLRRRPLMDPGHHRGVLQTWWGYSVFRYSRSARLVSGGSVVPYV
jgi:hypothetical protein